MFLWCCILKNQLVFIPLLFYVFSASGVCKHVGALLWHIEQEVRNGNNLTCTPKPQKWHKPSKKQQRKYAPAPLNDITIKKPKSERVLQDAKEKHYCRSLFDPRALHHQKPMTVTERD